MKLPVLPVYYYLDHFTEMLAFVGKIYGSVLTDDHQTFIARFERLSKDARCLFIRMLNRRGKIFNRSTLRYAEILNIEVALDDLMACGHARTIDARDYHAFAAGLAKSTLLGGAKAAGMTDVRTSWSKAKLVEYFLNEIAFESAIEHCGGDWHVSLDNTKPVEFLLYLYFCKTDTI